MAGTRPAGWTGRIAPHVTHSLPLTDPQGEIRPLDDIERDTIPSRYRTIVGRCRRSRGGSVSGAPPSIES